MSPRSDESLRVATVIEGTVSGNVLIGSSREFRGFDARMPTGILAKIAEAAIRLFPVLNGVRAIRAYAGFRPFSQDHLPIIGPDPASMGSGTPAATRGRASASPRRRRSWSSPG